MKTEKLLTVANWKEIQEAKDLGMKNIPEPQYNKTKFLFWKKDIKNAMIEGNVIVVEFNDESAFSFEYDERMWKQLEKFFSSDEK